MASTKIYLAMIKVAADYMPHQQRVIDKMHEQGGLLVYHGLGSGKTLTALGVGEQLGEPVTVIGPASLRKNFSREKTKHKVKAGVDYYSYNKPPGKRDHRVLVFDEAHRMGRSESSRSKYPEQYSAVKKILLTGTPIRNHPSELLPLMIPLGVDFPRDKKIFSDRYITYEKKRRKFMQALRGIPAGVVPKAINLKDFKNRMLGMVDYYEGSGEGYPEVREETVKVPMSKRQEKAYLMSLRGKPSLAYKIKHGVDPSKSELRNMNAFLSAARQISNFPGKFNLSANVEEDAPKITRAAEDILERMESDSNYRGVTYSAFIDSGIEPMAKVLDSRGVPYAVYTGRQSSKEKDSIVKQFNSGKVKQLLISGAGGEGLDLKGVKLLQIIEPHWNDPVLEQVRGRSIRYLSHEDLPENERVVEVKNYLAIPRKKFLFGQALGADEYLKMLSERKTHLNNQFLEALKAVSINSERGNA